MGRPKKYRTDEERLAAIREDKKRWRQNHYEWEKVTSAKRGRDKRAARAVAEGRPVGHSGNWRRFTKDDIKRKRREYVEQNRDLIRMHVRIRNARKRGAEGKHSVYDIKRLFDLQKGSCVMCLRPFINGKFHVDHHMPIALGGSNDRGNLRLLHGKCNLFKGARDPAVVALELGLLCW